MSSLVRSGLTLNNADDTDCSIPEDLLAKATVRDVEKAERVINESIGYPVMIKASEGGGGKGIRMVRNDAELRASFQQVQQEVPMSPIFIQKLSQNSRHLKYNGGRSVRSSDRFIRARLFCSDVIRKLSKKGQLPSLRGNCAKNWSAARFVWQRKWVTGVGTVEYLFNCITGAYSFLEVNRDYKWSILSQKLLLE